MSYNIIVVRCIGKEWSKKCNTFRSFLSLSLSLALVRVARYSERFFFVCLNVFVCVHIVCDLAKEFPLILNCLLFRPMAPFARPKPSYWLKKSVCRDHCAGFITAYHNFYVAKNRCHQFEQIELSTKRYRTGGGRVDQMGIGETGQKKAIQVTMMFIEETMKWSSFNGLKSSGQNIALAINFTIRKAKWIRDWFY